MAVKARQRGAGRALEALAETGGAVALGGALNGSA